MELARLTAADLALAALLVDAMVLIVEPVVDLVAPRMRGIPFGLAKAGAAVPSSTVVAKAVVASLISLPENNMGRSFRALDKETCAISSP